MTGVTLRVALAQISLTAGDLDGNGARIAGAIAKALAAGADILLTPEMAVSGYPVEDLLGEHAFLDDVEVAVAQVASAVPANLGCRHWRPCAHRVPARRPAAAGPRRLTAWTRTPATCATPHFWRAAAP